MAKLDSQLVQELVVFMRLWLALLGASCVVVAVGEYARQHRRPNTEGQWLYVRVVGEIIRYLRSLEWEIAS